MIAARRDVVPFCLEIIPTEPFKIPNDGFLEVKISNNTIHPYAIEITFDSFFFALQHEFLVKRECQGYSNTARSGFDYLEPTDSVTYKIGFSNEINPNDRINYKHVKPEGFLRIIHFMHETWPTTDEVIPYGDISETRIFELELEEETDKSRDLREQFEKIKKDQERMERWGHSLEVQDGLVYKIYKNDKGEVMKFDHFDRKDELLEKMAMDVPEDLEKIDRMTDEEVKKLRKEGMEKVKKNDEFWEKVREADANLDKEWPTDIIIRKVPESKVEKLEESKTKPIETEEKPRKSVIKQVEKSKSEVKKVEKPVIKPLPNSETIPASIKSAPPPPTKPEIPVKIEPKKEEVKLKKKKKNPCCGIIGDRNRAIQIGHHTSCTLENSSRGISGKERQTVPFKLNINPPPPFRIPAEGFLEVKIENNTTTTQIVGITFDSFFFELVGDGFNSEKGNAGESLSAIMGYERVPSRGSVTLKIGFGGEDGRHCYIYYQHARPEGFLRIMHFGEHFNENMILEVPPSSTCPVSETRVFELELEEETLEEEKYQKLRVKFEKIKKNQKRMERWGH